MIEGLPKKGIFASMRIRLRYKLFFVILLANALLTVVIVVGNNRAFSSGFDNYLEEVQSRRLEPLLETLAEEYQERGSWNWIVSAPRRWHHMARRYLVINVPPPPERGNEHTGSHPGAALQLKNAEGKLLIGEPREEMPTAWYPIEAGGNQVGELGVPRNLRLTSEFDRQFAERQQQQVRWIALFALFLAAVIAFVFARALVGPIARLQAATRKLASGHYQVKLPHQGSDEIAELARDFNVLAQTLAQNLDARQRWIADISHELRTPISTLQAELEALQDGVRQPDAATLQSLQQEIVRLGELVSDLHELSLSDAGALSYQKAPVSLTEVIEEVRCHYQHVLKRRNIRWQFDYPDKDVIISGDRHRLKQLVTNLINNSLSYTDGSEENPGLIHVELVKTQGEIRLTWSDSQPGVPVDAIPNLFERLYRVETSRNRDTGGSGLGLAIVRNIVEAHNGQISARPSGLGGLTLSIRFANEGEGVC